MHLNFNKILFFSKKFYYSDIIQATKFYDLKKINKF